MSITTALIVDYHLVSRSEVVQTFQSRGHGINCGASTHHSINLRPEGIAVLAQDRLECERPFVEYSAAPSEVNSQADVPPDALLRCARWSGC